MTLQACLDFLPCDFSVLPKLWLLFRRNSFPFPSLVMFAFKFQSRFCKLGITLGKCHSYCYCHGSNLTLAYLPTWRGWRLLRVRRVRFWNSPLTAMEAKYLHSYLASSVCVELWKMDLMAHGMALSCFFHSELRVANLWLYLLKCWKQDKIWSSFRCCCLGLTFLFCQGHAFKAGMNKICLLLLITLALVDEKHLKNLCTCTDFRFMHALHLSLLKCAGRSLFSVIQL